MSVRLDTARTAEGVVGPGRHLPFTRIIVGVLLIWFAADFAGTFLPIEWLHVLPESVAARRPGRYSSFIPNVRIEYQPWVGETALTGNLPPTETRGPILFSSDAWGYRLTPGVPLTSKFDLVLHDGASFAYGGGLSDDETLPSVMTRQTGFRMYNGGHFFWDQPGPLPLLELVRQSGGQKPIVVLLEWEQFDHIRSQLEGGVWRLDGLGRATFGPARYAQLKDDLRWGKLLLTARLSISPLEVLSTRFFKSISNDRILPNRYRSSVVERTDPRGNRLLFLAAEVRRTLAPPSDQDIQARAAHFAHYQSLLAAHGLDVYLVLLPNKYTLYGPLLDRIPPSPYFERFEQALVARGVKTLNMLPQFRGLAAQELATGDYSFYREDHHWTAKGVRLTAAALAARLRADRILPSAELKHALQ